jgi:hypothetical protein
MGGGHAFAHARVGRAHPGHVHRNRVAHHNINMNRNVNIKRNVARHVDRNVNRYVYRNGRRGFWRNGVWVAAPVVAGTAYVASCAYEYNRWQSTGSAYWRDRYYQCVR